MYFQRPWSRVLYVARYVHDHEDLNKFTGLCCLPNMYVVRQILCRLKRYQTTVTVDQRN